MNRRNFLGSILGTLIISKLNFLADPMYDLQLDQEIIHKNQDLIYMTNRELLYNIEGVINAGFNETYLIHSPKIKEINRFIDKNNATLSFLFEDVNATQQFITKGAGLLWKHSRKYIGSSNFTGGSQYLNNGDTLKCTYSLGLHNLSEKELLIFMDNK